MLDFVPQTDEYILKFLKNVLPSAIQPLSMIDRCLDIVDKYNLCKHYGITLETFRNYGYNKPSEKMIGRICKDVIELCDRYC